MTYYGGRSAKPLSEGGSYETIRNDKKGRLFVVRCGGAAVTGLRRSGAAEPERRLRADPSTSKARAEKRPRAGFQTRYRQYGAQIQTRTTVGSSGTGSPGPDKYFYQETLNGVRRNVRVPARHAANLRGRGHPGGHVTRTDETQVGQSRRG